MEEDSYTTAEVAHTRRSAAVADIAQEAATYSFFQVQVVVDTAAVAASYISLDSYMDHLCRMHCFVEAADTEKAAGTRFAAVATLVAKQAVEAGSLYEHLRLDDAQYVALARAPQMVVELDVLVVAG